MEQAKGFEIENKNSNERSVYELKKSLYGLKQSGRNCKNLLNTYLIEQNFCQSLSEWVGDILIATKCDDNMIHTKNTLKQIFKMKDQGKIKYFLAIEFTYKDNIIYMHQKQYLQRLLEKLLDCKPKYTPNDSNINKMCGEPSKLTDGKLYKEIVGSLINDNDLSRFMLYSYKIVTIYV